jgi:NAD-dependent deacetylase
MARSDSTRADAPQFEFDEALDAEIERAGRIVADARSVVALTGAGLSVESGIPPFRGPGGLWTRYGEPPMDGYQRFLRDPRKAHRAFAELERLGRCDWLITQNIDDLHRQAGTRNLLEIHGNYQLLRCLECGRRYERTEVGIDPERLPPHCPDCGGIVKGDTVQFGEPIPPDVLRGCFAAVAGADCMIVAGTSATVYPSADFPYEVLRRRGSVVEVNPYETELTTAATVSLRGPGAAVSERLLRCVARLAHGSRS